MKKVILYTPGGHGNFLRFLFNCYDANKLEKYQISQSGNWHLMMSKKSNNLCFDMANDYNIKQYQQIKEKHEKFHIIFDTFEEFYYLMQCFIDRGGKLLRVSGIELLEKNIDEYQKEYGVYVNYKETIKDLYKFEGSKVPKSVLRSFFILNFITHFDHTCWKVNKELKNSNSEFINVKDILNYDILKKQLDKIFNKSLDFENLHKQFLEKNYPYSQLLKVKELIYAIENEKDIPINNLNSISEAYLCFYFEKKYYDINFNLPDTFFTSTGEFLRYIKHFPNYFRKPNNLFLQHWRIYNDK